MMAWLVMGAALGLLLAPLLEAGLERARLHTRRRGVQRRRRAGPKQRPSAAFLRVGPAGQRLSRRARAGFAREFPDAVALLVRSLRAGLPIDAGLAEVARGPGPVAAACRAVIDGLRLGQPLDRALWAAARPVALPEFDFLVVTIALQRETGGNLAQTLAQLEATLRSRRQLALKVRAMAGEARASALIIGSLPFVMAALLALVAPDYLLPLVTEGLGRVLLAGGLISIGIGALVMHAMMQVEA